MKFLKRLFQSSPPPITGIRSIEDFWNWFRHREVEFAAVVRDRDGIESDFFAPVAEALGQISTGVLLLCGTTNDGRTELVFTADGLVRSIPFIRRLVAGASAIRGWKFTALKEPMGNADFEISMGSYKFSGNNIWFFPNLDEARPDLIDITIVYDGFNEADRELIISGCYVMLENLLGELAFSTQVDDLQFAAREANQPELIPLQKLPGYLHWREEEFVEKYDGVRRDTAADDHRFLKAQTSEGQEILVMINETLLEWDAHASHPWIVRMEFEFDAAVNGGMPLPEQYEQITELEERLVAALPDHAGYLEVAHQTGAGSRTKYLACRDFSRPAEILTDFTKAPFDGVKFSFEIYKDKYWSSFNPYREIQAD